MNKIFGMILITLAITAFFFVLVNAVNFVKGDQPEPKSSLVISQAESEWARGVKAKAAAKKARLVATEERDDDAAEEHDGRTKEAIRMTIIKVYGDECDALDLMLPSPLGHGVRVVCSNTPPGYHPIPESEVVYQVDDYYHALIVKAVP